MNESNEFESAVAERALLASSDFERRTKAPPAEPGQLKFGAEDAFYPTLRKRVDEYFKRTGRSQRDCPRMYLKTAIVLSWFAASYALLVFVGDDLVDGPAAGDLLGPGDGGDRI